MKTVDYMTVPPNVWCRVYGTQIEVLNPADEEVRVTSNLAGISGLKLRLAKNALYRPGVSLIEIYREEVNSDE